MRRRRPGSEAGFALPAAVAAIGVFALIAASLLTWGRGTMTLQQAQFARARLEAAAESGLALALHGLSMDDRARRWPVGGPPRGLAFDGTALTIAIEDERGKVALNVVEPEVVRALLASVGVADSRLDRLVDVIGDWIDQDDERRPFGAERADYPPGGPLPRNGPIQSLGELAELRDMDPVLVTALGPLISLVPRADLGTIDPRRADPVIIDIVNAGRQDGAPPMVRPVARVATTGFADGGPLTGLLVTIRVTAALAPEARLTREAIVEFTGDRRRPVWIRAYR